MRAQHIFLVILFSLLVSFPAIASDWVPITSTKTATMYIDKESIKVEKTNRKFWAKRIIKGREVDPTSGAYYNETKEYWEIDCQNHLVTFHEIYAYHSDGELVGQGPIEPHTDKIVPDTVADIAQKYVCSFKPTK